MRGRLDTVRRRDRGIGIDLHLQAYEDANDAKVYTGTTSKAVLDYVADIQN
jgi:hypothetical protein